ncbi:MAG: cation:proton antiporter [Actinomycetota bacterium]
MEHPEVLIELGAVILGLAILSRVSGRIGIPTIPLYLCAGLAFGRGGLLPLVTADQFIEVGAEIGLILLLFMLGLEYSASELISTLKSQAPIGVLDLGLNFIPGLIAGLLLGFGWIPAILLGGVTYLTSSGVVSKLLSDLGRIGNRETPAILSIIVIEDLAMAVYLPVVGILLSEGAGPTSLLPALFAVTTVIILLSLATHVEVGISRIVFNRSDEALLLSIVGLTLLIAGAAESLKISAAVAALLVGIVLSGPAAEGAQALLAPLRDLFAAIFFAFVGLSIDPAALPPVLGTAALLALVGTVTKFATGWMGARRIGVGPRGRTRAGAALIARGEFSIVIAGLATAAAVPGEFEALAITYIFLLAIAGPIFVRIADPIAESFLGRTRPKEAPEASS